VAKDIGGPSPAGAATVDYESGGTVSVTGAGAGMKGSSDAFQFTYRALAGDGSFIGRINPPNGSATSRGGLMLRNSLSANSANVFVAMDSSDRLLFTSRTSTATATSADEFFGQSFSGWVKITRTGNSVATFSSLDGVNWTAFRSVTLPNLASTVYVGLASTSGANGAQGVVAVDRISFQPVTPQL
jgi:hypothetical protein